MCDALRRLQCEAKTRRRARGPSFEHLGFGHRAERVVDFDRRHPLGVVLEHFGGGKFLRIKAAEPFLVRKARSANPDVRLCHRDSAAVAPKSSKVPTSLPARPVYAGGPHLPWRLAPAPDCS